MVSTRNSTKPDQQQPASTTTTTKANTTGKRSIKSVAGPATKDTTITTTTTRPKRANAKQNTSDEGSDKSDDDDDVVIKKKRAPSATTTKAAATKATKAAAATTQKKMIAAADKKAAATETTTTKAPPKKTKKEEVIPFGEQGERLVFVRDYLEQSHQAAKDGVEEVHVSRQVVTSAAFHKGKRFIVPKGMTPQVAGPKGDFLVFVGTSGYRRCFHIENKMDSAQFQAAINEVIGDFIAAKNPLFLGIPTKPGMLKTTVKKELEAAPAGSSAIFIQHADEMNICNLGFYTWNKAMTGPYYHLMHDVKNTSASLYDAYRQVAEDPDLFSTEDALAACHTWCERVVKKKGVSTGVKHPVPKK